MEQITKLSLTENQIKVIKDKYLKNSPTVEHWLRTICHNIALADLLHSEHFSEHEIFNNVSYKKIEYPSKEKIAKYYLIHYGLPEHNLRDANFKKFVANLEELYKKNPKISSLTEEKFYETLSTFKFLPNSPTLMNAGRDLQQLSACFREDQPIMTSEGIKPIIDIKKDDYVLTAAGTFKRVTETMERFVENYRIINIWKLPNQTLCVSDEHPILCLNSEKNKGEWKSASQITEEDYVAVSYPKEIKDVEKINIIDYLDNKNFVIDDGKVYRSNKDKRSPKYSVQVKPVKNEIKIDSDLMRILGYYISEGDIDNQDSVRFTFNSLETRYMEDLINLVEKKFGLKSKIEKSNAGNWSNVKFHSIIFAQFMTKIIGKGFNKKIIPSWILNLPVEKQKGLIIGILRGDGYGYTNRHTTNIRAVLSNQNLVYGLWVIFARLGMLSSFKKSNLTRLAKTDQYICTLDSYNSEKIFGEIFLEKEFKGMIQVFMRRQKELLINGVFYLPVKNISVVSEPIKVYNFEVEGEHTYVANNVSVHNCYVLPVEDSIDGIYTSVKNMALIHKSGGGTGFSFSKLRPSGDAVKTTKGISSGPISFMSIFDKSTDVVKQGGTRRGANMGIMYYTHPNILDFIDMKKTPGVMENFNVSVSVDENFMNAVRNSEDYELINPRGKEVVGKLNAREVWKKLIKGAWETGDPGIIFIDRMNNTASNATPHLGQIESTNPCVVGNSLISTEKGLMRMEKLVENYSDGGIKIATDSRVPIQIKQKDGTVMLMMQGQKNKINFDSIKKAFTTGIKQVYKLKTNSGYELECTGDHKLLTNEGWVKLTELNPEKHVIYIQQGEGTFNNNYNFSFDITNEFLGENGIKYSLNLPDKWSKELGQVIGWLIGDGWLKEGKNCRAGFTFGKDDLIVMNYLKPIINNYYGNNINEIKRKNGVYHLSYHSKYFIEFFKKLGVRACKAEQKIVPEEILTAPKEAVIGFLQGLFTADGTASCSDRGSHYYVRLTSKSEQLLKDVQLILLNLGIKSTIYNRQREPRRIFNYTNIKGVSKEYLVDGKCFELNIARTCVLKFLNLIGFMCGKHEYKTKNFYSKNLYKNEFEEKIKEIIPLGEKKVYDLIELRTLSFITNGFISLDCGEQPLLPYEPCNLGSINLMKFVKQDGSDFDYNSLRECVYTATHFLDNVIDINNYPIPEIEDMAKKTRRIGLGVMGWAEALVLMRIPYNSEMALKKAEEVMKFINDSCMKASEDLAERRGVFPAWKNSIFDKDGFNFREIEAYPRHSARTTIAPTGTIAITAGLQGSGIEPFFAIAYVRYNAAGIDALKRGDKPAEKDTFFEVNSLFEKIAEENYYFGLKKEELLMKVNNNHKSLVGLKEIPDYIQKLFLTSHDLNPKEHIMMQCTFQKYTDNAVSKTVNMKNDATEDDVEEVYRLAYEHGAKGVTIYRDGSKQFQVLNISDKKTEKKETKEKKNLPELADYYVVETGHGPVHMHINYTEEGPVRVFANLSPIGTEISGLTTALAILLSKYFRFGGDPTRILKHLNSIKSERPFGFGKNRVDSIPHAMAIALRSHLIKTGKIKTVDSNGIIESTPFEVKDEAHKIYCTKCFSANVGMVSGCSEPTCFDCGYSKCS